MDDIVFRSKRKARWVFDRQVTPILESCLVAPAERLPLAMRSSGQVAREGRRRGAVQKPKELAALLKLVRAREPQVIVEIGTAKGGTLYSLSQVAPETCLLISLDLPGGAFGGGYTERQASLMRTFVRDGQSVEFLRADSHAASTRQQLLELLADVPIDLLFIDGDHTYEGVRKDFEMYAPLVATHCLIAFHDVLPHPDVPDCKVDVFWDEIKNDHDWTEFITRPMGWGGIGVINKKR
jgi:predicted O-methyltransferase YrrM